MTDPNALRRFASLAAAAFVDGVFAEAEKQLLHRKALEMDIPIRAFDDIVQQGRTGKLAVAVPSSARERERLLEDLIDVACADGRVEAAEHHLLAKFAQHMGVALPDLRARVRDRMDRRGQAPEPPRPRAAEVPRPPAPPLPVAAPPPPAAPLPDLPPVTLHLIKQAILFESEPESLRYIQGMLGISDADARRVRESVFRAFPDLKPGSQQVRGHRS